ncbi:unnamed protein product [Closterium sp. NIES-65]|nr:unnamed protein product [Closterium sp. NIES-65]
MAAQNSCDFLQGALACTLPPPCSAHYSASAPTLSADSAVLPASALPFSPLSHALLRMSATTKPFALRATSPSPLRNLQQITERHVALARQFALGFATICDPYLNIFRGLIPPIGGTLDLSPILAFVVLSAFTNACVALPAEMPEGEAPGGEVSRGRGGMLGGRRRRPVRLTREQREKMRAASRAAEQGQEA